MSKELEALELLLDYAKSSIDETSEMIDVEEAYVWIKQALTPPTADEVCKALSDAIGHKVKYEEHRNKMFSTSCYMAAQYTVDGVKLGFHFKPHLITLLGQFYEGEIE